MYDSPHAALRGGRNPKRRRPCQPKATLRARGLKSPLRPASPRGRTRWRNHSQRRLEATAFSYMDASDEIGSVLFFGRTTRIRPSSRRSTSGCPATARRIRTRCEPEKQYRTRTYCPLQGPQPISVRRRAARYDLPLPSLLRTRTIPAFETDEFCRPSCSFRPCYPLFDTSGLGWYRRMNAQTAARTGVQRDIAAMTAKDIPRHRHSEPCPAGLPVSRRFDTIKRHKNLLMQ